MFKLLVSFHLILLSFQAGASYERPLKWSGNIYKIIQQHNKIFKKFTQQSCRPGDEAKYLKLLKSYRGQGYYLPKIEGHIDRKAILKNMPILRDKVNFVEKTLKELKAQKKLGSFDLFYSKIEQVVKSLLNLKKKHHRAITQTEKKKIRDMSRRELIKLKKEFNIFMQQLFFLKSYNYPNNFLELRARYEAVKDSDDEPSQLEANRIFFYRKIVEDGAYNPDKTRPDKFVRSTLDNLFLQIQNQKDFISENVRYDLSWVARHLKKIFQYGYKTQVLRLEEWRQRSLDNFKFYNEIIQEKNTKKAAFLVQKENEATQKLKQFVYQKQADVYHFWAKQPEINKALFALETILVNEVGVIDGPFGLERRAVAQVVLNRYRDDFYNQLEDDQPIVKFLDTDKVDPDDELWLNVLFKVGEFSFTYHYIPAVAEIFCPDMSSRGRSIRKKNLKIALKTLNSHDGSFEGMRYFSRISMFGKIDMSSVWKNYRKLPESIGYESSRQRQLMYFYHANKYQYLYNFHNKDGFDFTVVEIQDRIYSMRWIKGKPVFFDYRNPHLFTYFVKKNL